MTVINLLEIINTFDIDIVNFQKLYSINNNNVTGFPKIYRIIQFENARKTAVIIVVNRYIYSILMTVFFRRSSFYRICFIYTYFYAANVWLQSRYKS